MIIKRNSFGSLLLCDAKLFDGVGGERVGSGEDISLGLEAVSVGNELDASKAAVSERKTGRRRKTEP